VRPIVIEFRAPADRLFNCGGSIFHQRFHGFAVTKAVAPQMVSLSCSPTRKSETIHRDRNKPHRGGLPRQALMWGRLAAYAAVGVPPQSRCRRDSWPIANRPQVNNLPHKSAPPTATRFADKSWRHPLPPRGSPAFRHILERGSVRL
jgi:hypothetical protein